MATYNGEKFIRHQVDSILKQLDSNDEIIVSDGNSTDSTLQILETYNDKRIKIYNLNRNLIRNSGGGEYSVIQKVKYNFINALSYATGDIIFLCDQDDIWLENKVKVCIDKLRHYPLVVHSSRIINNNYEVIQESSNNWLKGNYVSFFQTLILSPFCGCEMAFTADVKESILSNADIICRYMISHDHAIGYLVMCKYGRKNAHIFHDVLHLYRRHGNNVSSSSEKSSHSIYFKISYRIYDILLYLRMMIRSFRNKL